MNREPNLENRSKQSRQKYDWVEMEDDESEKKLCCEVLLFLFLFYIVDMMRSFRCGGIREHSKQSC